MYGELTSCNCSHTTNIKNKVKRSASDTNLEKSSYPQFLPLSKLYLSSDLFNHNFSNYSICLLQSNTPHLYTALENRAASFSNDVSLFDIATFKLNSRLQYKGAPTSPNIKEIIKHYAVSKRIIRDQILIYTHTSIHKHTHDATESQQGGLLSSVLQIPMGG